MTEPTRIVLAERRAGRDLVLRFDGDAFVVEGLRWLAPRRVALRDVWGLERAGVRLWIGVPGAPLVLGGRGVASASLARAEATLRDRIAALPAGRERLARIDARRRRAARGPWLTSLATLGLTLAALRSPGAAPPPLVLADGLLLLGLGALAEAWLGPLPLVATGAAAWLVAVPLAGAAEAIVLAPLLVACAWLALLGVLRARRAALLGVRMRSSIAAALPLALLLGVQALAHAAPPRALFAATLAAALAAWAALRRATRA